MFDGLHGTDLIPALNYLNARTEYYKKDKIIVRHGGPLVTGIVLDGQAKLSYFDGSGESVAVDYIHEGMTFGYFGDAFEGHSSHFEVVAMRYTSVCRLDLNSVFRINHEQVELPHFHNALMANIIRSAA